MKINTTKIPNWNDLTEEQKALIEGLDLTEEKPDPAAATGKTVPKTQFDKLASEFAELKRKRAAEMSEEQRAKEEREQREQHYSEIEEKLKYYDLRDGFLNKGYDADTSAKLADAVGKNDMESFMTVSKDYLDRRLEAEKQSVREELLKQGAHVGTAGVNNQPPKSPEKMTYAELIEFTKNGGKL